MKRIISWILSMCMVLTLLAAVAPESQALPIRFHEIDMPRQTNPLYDDVVDLDRLPAYEKLAGGDFGTSATNPTYAESYMTAQEAESYMREAMKNRENVISLSFTHSNRYDINLIVESLVYSAMLHTGVSTEGDYLMWTWSTWEVVDGSYYSQGYNYYITIEYYVTYYTTASQEAEMDVAVNDLLAQLNLYDATDFAKVKGIYDYLCDNVTYDFDNLYDEDYLLKFTAYAALMHGTAVCQGYAVLFYRLALELGVDNRVVVGWQTSSGGSHAWNIAQLGEYYYNLDATWDAGYEEYDFFLTNEENFYDHTRDPEYDTSSFHSDYPMGTENYLDNTVGTLPSGIVWAVDPWMGILYFAGNGMVSADTAWSKYVHDIRRVEIGEGITSVGNGAFYEYEELQTVGLPESLVEIGNYAFDKSGLREINFPSNLKRIGHSAFRWTKLTNVVLPEGLVEMDLLVFGDCTELESIVFPESMTYIPGSVCSGCNKLTTVTIPDQVVCIGYDAFEDCSALTSVQLPSALETIELEAFGSNSFITELWIPATVTSIGNRNFENMSGLNAVYFLGDAPSFGSGVFNNIKGTVYYPRNNPTWTEEARTIYSSNVVWAPYDLPFAILKQPMDQTVNVGMIAEFKVIATGDGLTYQWQYATGTGWANAYSEGHNTNILRVPTTMGRNGLMYRCVITDDSGSTLVTNPVKLTAVAAITIISQPADCAAIAYTPVRFRVVAAGEGLRYQWEYYTGSGWANAYSSGYNTANLTVEPNMSQNGLLYRCKITDQFGNVAYTNSVMLTVATGIGVLSLPKDQTVNVGMSAQFSVHAVGDGLTYQWQYYTGSGWADAYSSGYNTATMTVEGTMNRNGLRYRCVIKDKYGNQMCTNEVRLTVNAAITLIEQPTDQSVQEGAVAKFTVKAVGAGLVYQWQYATGSGWADAYSRGYNTATLSVDGTMGRNGLMYRCEITDAYGNVVYTDGVKLNVKAGITITSQPTNQTVLVGQVAKFTVTATGEGLTYQWQYATGSGWASAYSTGYNTATLSVDGTMGRNGLMYRCKISDKYGNVVYTDGVKLNVKTGITITSQPTNQTVLVGQVAKFTVTATGDGLTYQWQYYTGSSWASAYSTGYNTATLSVDGTMGRNGLMYRCKITDKYGNVAYTNGVKLNVKAGITITSQPTNQTVIVGQVAKFTVTATGDGLTYQWQYYNGSSWVSAYSTGHNTATLTVEGTAARNGLQYRCKISDKYGNVVYTNSVKLTVR